jgi:hypothetical protein
MRQDADEGPTDRAADRQELEPVTLEQLRAAARRWQSQPQELARLLSELSGEGDEAVPSYRVGAAESTILFEGLDGLGEIVTETLEELYNEIEKEKAAERSAEGREAQKELLALLERAMDKRTRRSRWRRRSR